MSEKLYTCPHCGKELEETIAFNGICPGCHKGFDFANLNPKLTPPPYEEPKQPQPPKAPLNSTFHKVVSNLKNVVPADLPKSPGKTASSKGVLGCLGLIVFIAIVLAIARAGKESSSPPASASRASTPQQTQASQQETQKPQATIEATALCSEYENNKLGAEQKFKNKYFGVAGTVENIGRELGGHPYIVLKGSFGYNVQCVFPVEYTDKLAEISKGTEIINIAGTCKSELLGTILFDNCVLY